MNSSATSATPLNVSAATDQADVRGFRSSGNSAVTTTGRPSPTSARPGNVLVGVALASQAPTAIAADAASTWTKLIARPDFAESDDHARPAVAAAPTQINAARRSSPLGAAVCPKFPLKAMNTIKAGPRPSNGRLRNGAPNSACRPAARQPPPSANTASSATIPAAHGESLNGASTVRNDARIATSAANASARPWPAARPTLATHRARTQPNAIVPRAPIHASAPGDPEAWPTTAIPASSTIAIRRPCAIPTKRASRPAAPHRTSAPKTSAANSTRSDVSPTTQNMLLVNTRNAWNPSTAAAATDSVPTSGRRIMIIVMGYSRLVCPPALAARALTPSTPRNPSESTWSKSPMPSMLDASL